jgi:alanine racemase
MNSKSSNSTLSLAGGRLTIDLDALVANWRTLAARAPGAGTAAVVKGDGYGIGLEAAGKALNGAGCRTFFVAVPEEGRQLRAALPNAVIYVLDGLLPGAAEAYAAADLRPVLGSWPEIEEWAAFRRSGGMTGAAIHVDTGMNRLGLSLHDALEFRLHKAMMEAVAPDLLMSHLACADTPDHPMNARQLALFSEIRAEFPDVPASLANSAGIFLGSNYHFDLTRPGIALYGGSAVTGAPNPMRPVVTLEGQVLSVREADAGESVGYGATETLKRTSRIAILGVGYADGYHRLAGSNDDRNGAYVIIRGRAAPLVGRVSMDLVAIDVTDIQAVSRGDWAELFGAHVALDDVARFADTIGYELLTGLGRRYARTYVNGAG